MLTMNHFPKIVMAISISVLVFSCGKSDLDRRSAEEILERSDKIEKFKSRLPLNSQADKKAFFLGIVNKSGNLTEKGRMRFKSFDSYSATLVNEIDAPNIDVTGITSHPAANNMRLAEFDLSLAIPSGIKSFAARGGTGEAVFRLYDDGWRLEDVDIDMSHEPYPMTEAEMRAEADEIARIDKERSKRKARLQKKIEQSRKPKETIVEYTTGDVLYKLRGAMGSNNVHRLILSDVGIKIDIKKEDFFGSPSGEVSFEFGVDSYIPDNNCPATKQHLSSRETRYIWMIFSDSYTSNPNRLLFPSKGECERFERAFRSAYKSWLETYRDAYMEIANM